MRHQGSFEEKRKLIVKSGWFAGSGLFLIYAGLISIGAYYGSQININEELSSDMQRANLLRSISITSLGSFWQQRIKYSNFFSLFHNSCGYNRWYSRLF